MEDTCPIGVVYILYGGHLSYNIVTSKWEELRWMQFTRS